MKIKITHPIADMPEIQVGHVVEVSDILAEIWIAEDWAIEVVEIDATALGDKEPVTLQIEQPKRKVKHGDR